MSNTSILAYLILTISIGYAFIYPSFGDISELQSQKQNYEDSLATVSNIENKKNELLTQYNSISEADKKNLETVLPDTFNFVRLISDIDSVASKHGISITNITSRELTDPTVGDTVETAGPEKKYKSGIVGFTFTSTYENFLLFSKELEKSLRVIDMRSVKIESENKGNFTFTVEFETYWQK